MPMISATSASAPPSVSPARDASSLRRVSSVPGGDDSDAVTLSSEARQLAELKARDREVRAHEAAHQAVGGRLVRGAASYTYQAGPDGIRYAIGGEVSIDISPGATPEETLAKAIQIRAAALAPADPSAQDMQVAANAVVMAAEARAELASRQATSYQNDPTSSVGTTIDAFA